jgi:ferrochelatase
VEAPEHGDALLIMSFGGPEGPDDVMPFLENVTRGRGVPPERLAEVAEQYLERGGVSPINAQNRALAAAVAAELDHHGPHLAVYLGNRNWHPFVSDTVAAMVAAGVTRALVLTTSAFPSYSGCRQYQEDLAAAAAAVGPSAPALDKLPPYGNHPGFVEAMADRLCSTLAGLDPAERQRAELVFTAHSLPASLADSSDYVPALQDAAAEVVARARPGAPWDLVFQSRSGPPQVPWLEPDIKDHIAARAAAHRPGEPAPVLVVVPIGFVSDHMEVLVDLDSQAAAVAATHDVGFHRVPTVGTHPRFVTMIRELVTERLAGSEPLAVGSRGPRPNVCPPDCCPPPLRVPPRSATGS